MSFRPHWRRRSGLSLLEVMVAMAIFLFSVIAIAHMIGLAGDRALVVQRQSQAIQLCQAKMAEVIAGSIPLSSQSDVPLDEDPDWHWSLDAQSGSVAGLWNVNIKVSRQGPTKIETSLSQLVLDPSLRGNNMQPVLTPDMPSSSGTDSSSPSSTTPGPNAPAAGPSSSPSGSKSTPPPSGSNTSKPPAAPSAPSSTPKPPAAPSAPSSTPKPPTPSPAPKAPAAPSGGGK